MDALNKLMAMTFNQETININGTTFIVKEMNAQDKAIYENSIYEYKQVGKELKVIPKLEGAKTKLVIYTLHDEKGEKVFKGLEDLGLVEKLPASIIEKICDTAGKLNGLNQEEVTKN
jgi:hypothetical protein